MPPMTTTISIILVHRRLRGDDPLALRIDETRGLRG